MSCFNVSVGIFLLFFLYAVIFVEVTTLFISEEP